MRTTRRGAGGRKAANASVALTLAAFASVAHARPISLADAIRRAMAASARVVDASARDEAAATEVDEARTALLPRVDAMIQLNRATNNNLSGAMFGTPVFPVITGPVPASAEYAGSWGLALGALFSWDVVDFGRRASRVGAAKAGRSAATAELGLQRFEAGARAADAWLRATLASAWLRSAQASERRWSAAAVGLGALVRAKLRAAGELRRVEVALGGARLARLRAEESQGRERIALARAVGEPGAPIEEGGTFAPARLAAPAPDASTPRHPALVAAKARVQAARGREAATAREAFPELRVLGFAVGRGTGADARGARLGGAHGLYPEAFNWGVGVVLNAPILEFLRVRRAKQAAGAKRRAAEARVLRAERDLVRARAEAELALRSADAQRALTPERVRSARLAADEVRARFQAGLATLPDFVEAERALTEAEVDDAVAAIRAARARLALALADGDLDAFVRAIEPAGSAP